MLTAVGIYPIVLFGFPPVATALAGSPRWLVVLASAAVAIPSAGHRMRPLTSASPPHAVTTQVAANSPRRRTGGPDRGNPARR